MNCSTIRRTNRTRSSKARARQPLFFDPIYIDRPDTEAVVRRLIAVDRRVLRTLYGPPRRFVATITGRHISGLNCFHKFRGDKPLWMFQFPDGTHVLIPAHGRLWGKVKGQKESWLL